MSKFDKPLDGAAFDQIFRQARTYNQFADRPVEDSVLRELYDLMKWGPTSANMSPTRLVFVKSAEAKKKLEPVLDEGNREKTMKAPVTAIVGYDMEFYEKLPFLFPHTDARSWFAGKSDEQLEPAALRNSSLQGAYLIIAARALGLDCGPMSGFDNAKLDEAFFAGTRVRSNFIINLGYGQEDLFPRSPRLAFDEAARIA
ncbi:malonic semialdehyde reductase [Alkalisalibacterium limincola]|uniref:Putative NADH dehydrogenase/NAD(P)H nitroreductase FU658_10960 n=1 Tax=Alkalisalibacterium limincola TaxID=2699169 RepID=A0A5C8KJX8_9GAMM|nr:malonic semialdehyde reductase [Alkalisalibacterium limincola]TXK61073.1 malonic semialdehyde reductase [Alkalisalibacterium limincola]